MFGVVAFGVYTFGDGVGRPEQPTTAEITGARYDPPYTTQSCSRDSNGNQSCHTVYHPKEFHIRIQIQQSQNSKDIQVSKSDYRELKEAAEKRNVYYQAVYREGRWSHQATWVDLARSTPRLQRANYGKPPPPRARSNEDSQTNTENLSAKKQSGSW